MKMLVCIDGSEQSQKALEKALLFAEGSNIDEVGLIHVYEGHLQLSASVWGGRDFSITEEELNYLRKVHEDQKQIKEEVLQEGKKAFETKNIKVKTFLEEGHPAHIIVEVAANEDYDFIVIGSRGLGGLKKLFLGSVSNAVAQEAKNCCVIIVK